MKRLFGFVFLFVFLIALPVWSAKPAPLAVTGCYVQVQDPVEQQTPGGATQPDAGLWVVNRVPNAAVASQCSPVWDFRATWDADDQHEYYLQGILAPGEAFRTVPHVLVADWSDHLVAFDYVVGRGTRPEAVQIRLVIDGSWGPWAVTNRQGETKACFGGPKFQRDSPQLQPVPDSGAGGVGLLYSVRLEVQNLGNKRASVGAKLTVTAGGFEALEDIYCPQGYPLYENGQSESYWYNGQIDPQIWWDGLRLQ